MRLVWRPMALADRDTIMDYIAQHNDNPKTFVWTAKAEAILDKVARAWDTLNVASE